MNRNLPTIDRETLEQLYNAQKMSMQEIAAHLSCSLNKVAYWMNKYSIPRRSISEAIYYQNNPSGDPFSVSPILSLDDSFLAGLGYGLYWGEGAKSNKYAVRLGNTDPALIKYFIMFLEKIYGIPRTKLKFGIQIFSDMDVDKELSFWIKYLEMEPKQFQKPIVTISGSIGTYKAKSKHGVLTIHFNNKKLRDILVEKLAAIAQSVERNYGKVEVSGSTPDRGSI